MLAGLTASFAVSAAPLTPGEALARVSADRQSRIVSKSLSTDPVFTVKSEANLAAAYVFVAADNNGFAILSADDVAYPVLGYSDSGSFDAGNIPVNMQAWLAEMAAQIEWARNSGAEPAKAPSAPEGWTAISPLVKTTWDQGEPYNDECPSPKNSTQHAYTGCVATSMAQAMNYCKYPEHGEGVIDYYLSTLGVRVYQDLADINFDWDNMLDSYSEGAYTSRQAKAVADLMAACGYSVRMNYGLDASGASGFTIGRSLRNHFNYDSDCHSKYRLLYSMSEWAQMVYDNLKNIGPLIINGRDPGDMGHSFICDGYDGKGYFHFNWGWSGVSDGYYSLDALNPDSMGIGGYGSGFNFGQNAIFGIQPPTGKPSDYKLNLVQLGNTTGQISGSNFSAGMSDYASSGYANYCDETVSGTFGLRFEKIGSSASPAIVEAKLGRNETVELEPGYSIGSGSSAKVTAAMPVLDNGEYKVTVMFRLTGGEWEEILVPWGYNNFVYLTRSENGLTVTKPEQNALKIVSAEVASRLNYDAYVNIKLKVENTSDIELTQGLVPNLLEGSKTVMSGSNSLITVGPKQTADIDLVVNFAPVNGYSFMSPTDFVLNFKDPETNRSYGDFGTYTMEKGASSFSFTLKKLEVADASRLDVTYASQRVPAYMVNNPEDFDVNFNYSVRAGYFAGFVKLSIYKVDPSRLSLLLPITSVDEVFTQTAFMEKGDVSENEVNVNFPDAENDVLYAIVAKYNKSQSWANLGNPAYFMKTPSAVDGITDDSDVKNAEYYNLQGLRINNPKKGQVVIRRVGDKTQKIVIR